MTKNSKSRPRSKRAQSKKERSATRLGAALRALGGLGGGFAGSLIGQSGSGRDIGTSIGASLSRWLGSGDYTLTQNSIVDKYTKGSNSIPMMHNSQQTVIIRHKEYLGEVKGKQAFTVQQSFELNPGVNTTFPWLAGIAKNFQEYRFRGIVFHYVPSSGSAVSATNGALGTVMMQTSYRADDNPPNSKIEMLNEYCSSESPPNEAFCHPIECDPKENPLQVQYVRTGVTEETPLFYDLGVTHIAVSGQQADDKALGDLWVTYEVELKKPLISSDDTAMLGFSGYLLTSSVTASNVFPSTISSGAWINEGNLAMEANGNVITFPKGSAGLWRIEVIFYASGGFSSASGFAVTPVNATLVSGHGFGSSACFTSLGTSATYCILAASLQINDPSVKPTLTISGGSLTGTSTTIGLTVSPLA